MFSLIVDSVIGVDFCRVDEFVPISFSSFFDISDLVYVLSG